MSGLAWDKFFWSDYASDPALKICSFAAQGLWMRMLCIMAEHDPVGWLAVNGQPLDSRSLARMTGGGIEEVEELLKELARNGVFSRDRRGWIYSRRQINDAKKRRIAREVGKLGGNPKLRKTSEKSAEDNQQDKAKDKRAGNPQSPEARVQSKKTPTESKKIRLPDDWEPEPFGDGTQCRTIVDGWSDELLATQLERFKAHHEKEGSKFVDWQAAWRTWVLNSVRFAKRDDDRGQRQAGGGNADFLQHYVSKEMAGAKR